MTNQTSQTIATQALEQLHAALKAGPSETLRKLLVTMARFRSYSASNVMLIYSQRPDATHVAGFQTWRKLGRFVKRGECGLVIFAPIRPRADQEGDSEKPSIRFRAVRVFDISQTDGDDLPEPARVSGDPAEHLHLLRQVIAEYGISTVEQPLAPGILGRSEGGRIVIATGLSPAEQFATLVHEFAHELMHQQGERPDSKTVRETEAEAVAFVVGHAIGLEIADASRDYIQLYDGDAETLTASLSRIQKTSRQIVDALLQPQAGLATAA